jgi:hypothetical protein
MTSRAWVVHRKPHHVDCMKVFLAKNIVAIGWPELNFFSLSRDAVESRLHAYGDARNLTKALNVVWSFVSEIEKKDLVLVPEGRIVHVGTITSDYQHQPAKASVRHPYLNQRTVSWLKGSPFSKNLFPIKVQRTLKAQSPPVIRLDANAAMIRAFIAGSKPKEGPSGTPKRIAQKSLRGRPVGYKDEAEVTAFRKAAEVRIRSIHRKLINDFNSFIEHRVSANEYTYDILIDRGWKPGRTLLIEAKSQAREGAGRHQLREAIGQLYDYRLMLKNEHQKNIDLAVLTPEKPDPELVALVYGDLNIEMIWQAGSGFRGTKGVSAWLRQ